MPPKPLVEFVPLPLPPLPPASEGWGARIEVMLARFAVATLNHVGSGVQTLFAWSLQNFVESFEASGIDLYGSLFESMTEGVEMPDEVRSRIREILNPNSQAGLAALGGFGVQLGMGAASSLLAPLMRYMNYGMDRVLKSARVDPTTAVAMQWRFPEWTKELFDDMNDLGWPDHMQDIWKEIVRPTVPEGNLISLWRRELEPEEAVDAELAKRGWTEERIAKLKAASEVLPGVQDLILMAVREVFAPAERKALNLDAEFPPAFSELAATIGLPEEWARNYWAAHWQLPSLGQGFEMFQRLRPETTDNPFTMDDLKGLIKAQDFAPVWRERLIQIAYRPYTRVDVRRMFQDNILTEEQVFSAYKDIGYDDEKAGNLTAWTIAQGGASQKDLTRAAIIKGYKKRIFSVTEARQTLSDIGMGEDQIEFWISLADLEIAEAQANEIIGGVQYLYVNGAIDTTEVYSKLGPLNMPATQVEELLTVWTLKREAKTTLPGRGELEEFYERGIITEGDFRAGLLERRYRSNEVQWYIDKSDDDIAQRALVEAERSAREQDRIIASDLSSDYAVARSGLDVEIAELKLSVAETTLAIKLEADPAAKQAMKEYKAELAVTIATRKVEKAQLAEALALAKSE